ncbi:MAG: hypothetical protein M1833_004052 [Piccolia ochrophora]|nr:MAG: hypothetical protein M1833_004052 [Piccolia ochrophora]
MPAATPLPKSILKPPPPTSPPTSKEAHNRAIALHHARLIQARKDAESLVLNTTITLLEFPTASPSDLPTLKRLLAPFTPSDWDSLIEERNIAARCGYPLCPRPNKHEDTTARYRILGKTGNGDALNVVPTATLERWCSDECARKAAYVRVQLSEDPAWQRPTGWEPRLQLLEEEDEARGDHAALADRLGGLNINRSEADTRVYGGAELVEQMNDLRLNQRAELQSQLALERGSTPGAPNPLPVDVLVRESTPTSSPRPPSGEGDHMAIEGHRPGGKVQGVQSVSGSRGTDGDWDLQ